MRLISVTTLAFALLVFSAPARADVPPPDACNPGDTPGKACNNAGPGYDQPGTCQAAKCLRASPDGSIEYDCVRCTPAAGGAGGSGNAGTGSGGTSSGSGGSAGASGTKSSSSSDDSSCGCRTAQAGGAAAFLLALVAGALLAARRRN